MTSFECDKAKARSNYEKHRLRFTDAARALKAGYSLTMLSPSAAEYDEERYVSIAKRSEGRAIVMIWTPRNKNSRIISVRHARRKERERLDAYLKTLQ